jgi:transposase-like protein
MFEGCHFPSEVILETIRYYLAYKISYREIEEIQLERGVVVDHATIHRWVYKAIHALLCFAFSYRNLSFSTSLNENRTM